MIAAACLYGSCLVSRSITVTRSPARALISCLFNRRLYPYYTGNPISLSRGFFVFWLQPRTGFPGTSEIDRATSNWKSLSKDSISGMSCGMTLDPSCDQTEKQGKGKMDYENRHAIPSLYYSHSLESQSCFYLWCPQRSSFRFPVGFADHRTSNREMRIQEQPINRCPNAAPTKEIETRRNVEHESKRQVNWDPEGKPKTRQAPASNNYKNSWPVHLCLVFVFWVLSFGIHFLVWEFQDSDAAASD